MLAMFVTSSKAKEVVNFQIDTRISEGLPVVHAKYADNTVEADHYSDVAVRHTGSVDTKLWHELIRKVYIPCFKGKLSKEPVCDPVTLKLISGPLIVKTDAGSGRLSKEADSVDSCEELADMGVHVLLSLLNGTSCTAEINWKVQK